ncbi:MAG TPA: serine hydrolase domain-containing protein, partial [Kofleriaceae bacterium]|nr:serine hydrolase domain-containing protein [Kofleriaceae bacterium]
MAFALQPPGLMLLRCLVLAGLTAACGNHEMPAVATDAPPADTAGDGCPPTVRSFDPELTAAVAMNAGKGGGILRVECTSGRLLFEGGAGGIAAGDMFEIQSTTKTFTAALVLMFVEDGRVTLDTPLGSVLPATDTQGLLVIANHDYGPELTLRQLMHHTAGLPDYWNDGPFGSDGMNAFQRAYVADPDRMFEPRELVEYARHLTPIALPGTKHHYTDTGYVLLGLVIEQLAGKPYHQVMRERILTPLGLTHTYLRYREADLGPVTAWYDDGELVAGVRHQSADWAGGGYVSTAADLARFLRALADREILHEQETLDAMREWGPTDVDGIEYGLGLYRVDYAKFGEPQRGSWWGHDGYGNAFMYAMDPNL